MDKAKVNQDYGKTQILRNYTLPILTACPGLIKTGLPAGDAAKEIIVLNEALAEYFMKD